MKMNGLNRLLTAEDGQGMAEYVFILALIAMVVMIALGPMGEAIAAKYVEITGAI